MRKKLLDVNQLDGIRAFENSKLFTCLNINTLTLDLSQNFEYKQLVFIFVKII